MPKKNIFQLTDREVELTYLGLQTLVQHALKHGDVKPAIETDSLRASLRNCITRRLSAGSREVQENYEESARFIVDGKWDK